MKWLPPRGTRDLLPDEMALRNDLFDKFRKVFESYGYGQVETPAFESFDLLSKKSGEEIEQEIYAFEDKSKRKLGLRFDPTVPIARIVSSDSSIPKPIKFYYITRMWRYDRPQAGRYREFWQSGVELIGPRGTEADLEIIKIVSDLLKSVGIENFYFRISSRQYIDKYLDENKKVLPKTIKKKTELLRTIDKVSKIGRDGVEAELRSLGIPDEEIMIIDCMLDNDKPESDVKWKEYLDIMAIRDSAKSQGIDNVEIDVSIVRGIDYYTGFVFETFIKGKENLGSICSGGRYDNLIKTYGGEDLPAVGFGLGIDRLLDAVGKKAEKKSAKVFVAFTKDDIQKSAKDIARALRYSGINCETELMGRDFKKQVKYVNSKGIEFMVIVGSEELKNNKVRLKNMKTGKEKDLKAEDLLKELS